MTAPILPRLIESNLKEALDDTPVVLIHGARQCGKSTLAQSLQTSRSYSYLTFDDPSLVEAAKADPLGFVYDLPSRVILDEVQRVPEIFVCMKQVVDENRSAGRFLITGSTNIMLLPKLSESLAGRMELLDLYPFAHCELQQKIPLLPALLSGLQDDKNPPKSFERLGSALPERLIAGGFYEALMRPSEKRKQRWYKNYTKTLIERDLRDLAKITSPESMAKILQFAASQTAQLFNLSRIAAPLALSRMSVASYLTLLKRIFLLEELPAWHDNRLKRLVKTPKIQFCDTGLACAVLGINSAALKQDRKMLGHLLETFVFNELKRQSSACSSDLHFYHYRDKDKKEIDIIIDSTEGLLAIEVKAAASVERKDFRVIETFASLFADKFTLGLVFYDGERILRFGEKLRAIPISAL